MLIVLKVAVFTAQLGISGSNFYVHGLAAQKGCFLFPLKSFNHQCEPPLPISQTLGEVVAIQVEAIFRKNSDLACFEQQPDDSPSASWSHHVAKVFSFSFLPE